MKRLLILPIMFLMLASCNNSFTNSIAVEQVQTSDDPDYDYMVTLNGNGPGQIVYYTDYKYQVGDSLMGVDEFIQKEVDDRLAIKAENELLKHKLDSVKSELNSMKFEHNLMVKYYQENILKRDIMLGDEAPKEEN